MLRKRYERFEIIYINSNKSLSLTSYANVYTFRIRRKDVFKLGSCLRVVVL